MSEMRIAELEKAAANMDWDQVVANGGPPCFYLEGSRFCGRAERWQGHEHSAFHKFTSLLDLLREADLAGIRMGLEAGAQIADSWQLIDLPRKIRAIDPASLMEKE